MKLPALLVHTEMDEGEVNTLQTRLQDFLKFLAKRQGDFFKHSYVKASADYVHTFSRLPSLKKAAEAAAAAAAIANSATDPSPSCLSLARSSAVRVVFERARKRGQCVGQGGRC